MKHIASLEDIAKDLRTALDGNGIYVAMTRKTTEDLLSGITKLASKIKQYEKAVKFMDESTGGYVGLDVEELISNDNYDYDEDLCDWK